MQDDHHPPGEALAEREPVPPKPRTQFQLRPQPEYENDQVPTSGETILASWMSSRKPKGMPVFTPSWLPPVDVVGDEQLPVLKRVLINPGITAASAFTRPVARQLRKQALLHGFVQDTRLAAMLRNPARFLPLVAEHEAVIAPDFSMYDCTPPHQRIHLAWLGRACAAYFQHHGLKAIPNIRWTTQHELSVLLDGLPSSSCIAISTQSLLTKDATSRLCQGMALIREQLDPAQVIVYGKLKLWLRRAIGDYADIINIPTDISRAHEREVA